MGIMVNVSHGTYVISDTTPLLNMA